MRITHLMADRRITATQIASDAGIHHSVISKLLHGKNQPTATTVRKLCAAYPDLTPGGIMADYFDASRVVD